MYLELRSTWRGRVRKFSTTAAHCSPACQALSYGLRLRLSSAPKNVATSPSESALGSGRSPKSRRMRGAEPARPTAGFALTDEQQGIT